MNPTVSDTGLQEKQRLRKQRHAMAFATYLVPLSLVVLCWHQGLLAVQVIYHFSAFTLIINLTILFLIHKNINLRFRDPSLTSLHIAVSPIPTLWVMYFLENGHARSIFMMILVLATLYGILELNTRRFLITCLWIFLLYSFMILALWWRKPEVLNLSLEFIQAAAFVLVMFSISIIGGFISSLRAVLRKRNYELQNALEKIEQLASIDPLTGVANRRRLFETLEEEVNRFSRGNLPLSVCLIDIDRFKQVNDDHGHLAGDEILRKVACCISEGMRSIDTFGRYGGEEFLMILPHTPIKGARLKAEKVRRRIASLAFPEIDKDLRITISAGVAGYRAGEDIDATLLRADRALYLAKQQGRNRVVSEKDGLSAG